MNKVRNVLNDFGNKWIIFANKELSENEKINAVKNLTELNQGGQFSFVNHKTVIFDIDSMVPLSEADYNSLGKDD